MGNKFVRQFFLTELAGFIFGLPLAGIYVYLLLDIDRPTMYKSLEFAGIVGCVVVILAQFINYSLSYKIKNWINEREAGKLKDEQDAQKYLETLERLPWLHGFLIFLRVGLGAFIGILNMFFLLHVSFLMCFMSLLLCLYGAFLAGVVAFVVTNALVMPHARALVSDNILSDEYISKHKKFGLSVLGKFVIFLIIPVIMSNLSIFLSIYSSWIFNVNPEVLVAKAVGILVVNIFTLVAFVVFASSMVTRPLATLEKILSTMAKGGNFREKIPTDLSDEFAYVSHLMNQAMGSFVNILEKLKSASNNLSLSIQDLNVASQEISTTSNQQAAGVKEIVATMEDSDNLSKQVALRIGEVAQISEKTKDVVGKGFTIIQETLNKMQDIRNANTQSIQGIRDLGDKIESIWEIVNIINNIADQTKIIAFNAELEAASAGEAGKNFQIVATEIRRLADGTVSSTNEIKARINEIQNSSDNLIVSSEEGTSKVNAGWELSGKLKKLFEDILSSSEISAESASKIAQSIGQQVSAFEQILLTLRQISTGIDSFVTSTRSTSKLTKVLMDMAEELRAVVMKYDIAK